MGCNCGKKSTAAQVHYQVTYADGRQQLFLSESQAQREADRKGGTMATVPRQPAPA